jgi:AcrR family transcriptional regulator
VARAKAQDRRRQRILGAAYEAFSARSYDDVTLADLAVRAGTSERTVYRLFGTKRQLLSLWLREGAPGMAAWPDPAMMTDTHTFVRDLVDFYEQHGLAILNMLSQEESVPALRRLLDDGRERYEKGIERGLRHLLRGVRGVARKQRQLQLATLCDVQMWSLLRRGKRLPRAEVERVLTDMLAAIGTAPQRRRADLERRTAEIEARRRRAA